MINKTKRQMVPPAVLIPRKTYFWSVTPQTGKHNKESSIALLTVLRDYAKLGDKEREITRILSAGEVKVDGKVVKERRTAVGFMDIVSIPSIKKSYRVIYDTKGRLVIREESDKNRELKPMKVMKKVVTKGGKIQLSFHDGQNILTQDASIKPGDVLIVKVPEKEIKEVVKMQTGNKVFLTGGSHVGTIATVKKIEIKESSHANLIHFQEDFSTITDYAFPVSGPRYTFDVPSTGVGN
ncbi:MAG: 30S ribosomal protein S4e [Thermoplasmataceae archaeon]